MRSNLYSPEEIRPLYGEIVPAYQAAFAGPPWNEVSKCVDVDVRCVGGLSPLAIGASCDICEGCPVRPAYDADELIKRFDELAASRPTAWYAEQSEEGLTMAAVAWKATPSQIAAEKYPDVPEMAKWFRKKLLTPAVRQNLWLGLRKEETQIAWLDEVFANKQIKPKGNLQNFGRMVVGLAERLDAELVAYRTIEPRMTAVATRDFGKYDATVFERSKKVPDRRDFVIIDTMDRIEVPVIPMSAGIATSTTYRKERKQL